MKKAKKAVIIQNLGLQIVSVSHTLTRAMDGAGIDRSKYEYVRQKLQKERMFPYKNFIISRHEIL